MQPIKIFLHQLEKFSSPERYLFTLNELRVLLPDLSISAMKTLLSRAVARGDLTRICRGLYFYDRVAYPPGLLLFHVAAKLRSHGFNYISLETVLSDAGVISQIPINRITLISSGRSSEISCGNFGVIEFVHSTQKPANLKDELTYDSECHLWRASVRLALRDMKMTRRNLDLINWSIANEFI
jgi:predicted transcriptional regulator of viral defense system